MERLTRTSNSGGVAFTFDLDITCQPSEARKILNLATKLKEYEDLEEQGRLIKLPCCRCDNRTAKINKARVNSLEIIAHMLNNKPYYELRYRRVGEKDYSVGYSSYDLKTVLGYIDTYFEIVKSDKQTNADRIRNMSDEELLDFICSIETYEEGSVKTIRNGIAMCSVTEIEKWLQSEAE